MRLLLALAAATPVTAAAAAAAADFTLHNLFSDSMVLQADAPTIFGTCHAGALIQVGLNGTTKSAKCEADGRWKVVFSAQQ
eukprot:SAG11_NODE_27154_length_336_cov_0.658228_1_plen_80_part_01